MGRYQGGGYTALLHGSRSTEARLGQGPEQSGLEAHFFEASHRVHCLSRLSRLGAPERRPGPTTVLICAPLVLRSALVSHDPEVVGAGAGGIGARGLLPPLLLLLVCGIQLWRGS